MTRTAPAGRTLRFITALSARLTCPKPNARPIRHNGQVPDRNGKIFYTSITSLSKMDAAPNVGKGPVAGIFQIDLLSPPKMILGAVDGKRIGLLRQDRTVRGKVDRLMKAIVAVPTKRSSASNQQKPGAEKRPITAEKRRPFAYDVEKWAKAPEK